MNRRYRIVSRRAKVLICAFALWILLRIGYDQYVWHYRETTVLTLTEGPYQVSRVVDGGTLVLIAQANTTSDHPSHTRFRSFVPRARVRLMGVAVPGQSLTEQPFRRAVVDRWQDAATDFTLHFVVDGKVRLRLDRRRIDRAGVFLAYVFIGNRLLNAELVRAGLARVDTTPGDSAPMITRLRKAEQEARQARRGMWSTKEPTDESVLRWLHKSAILVVAARVS